MAGELALKIRMQQRVHIQPGEADRNPGRVVTAQSYISVKVQVSVHKLGAASQIEIGSAGHGCDREITFAARHSPRTGRPQEAVQAPAGRVSKTRDTFHICQLSVVHVQASGKWAGIAKAELLQPGADIKKECRAAVTQRPTLRGEK